MRTLASLIELARELRALNHHVATIEIVGGNRIEGLQPYEDMENGEIVCFAKLRTEISVDSMNGQQHSIVNVVAEAVNEAKLTVDERLTFAVELEPGNFFAIRNIDRVGALIKAIDAHHDAGRLRQILGLNLDVGHYALAGIPVAQITPNIQERIAHIHLSDHRGGHLADLSLGNGGLGTRLGMEAFDPWIDLILRCYATAREPGMLPLSGLVSLEMEAATSLKDVHDSLNQMKRWF